MTTSPTEKLSCRSQHGPVVVAATWIALWIVGQLFRDVTWLTGLCFYVPTPVVAAMLGLSALLVLRTRRQLGWAIALLSLAPLLVAVFVENRPFTAVPAANLESEFRIVHWNVGSRLRSPGTIDILAEQRADLIVLSEAGPQSGIDQLLRTLGPEWHSQQFAGLAVLSRDPIQLRETWLERRRTMVRSLAWGHRGRSMHVLVVDLPSELNVPRDPLLREIHRIIDQQEPDLVVGDFNAPRRSWALTQLPAGYEHAFDTVGHGCGYTWPSVAPMLAIDLVIFGPRIVPVRYVLGTSLASDHRYQVFDAAVRGS